MIFVWVSGVLTVLDYQPTQPGFQAVLEKFLLYVVYRNSPFESACTVDLVF